MKRPKGGNKSSVSNLRGTANDDSDLEEDDGEVDENDFYDDIQLDEENRKALEMFQNK